MGPTTEATPNERPNIETKTGRLRIGTYGWSNVIQPEVIKADAAPATARPAINVAEVGAAPQRVEPTSKANIENRKTLLV